MLATPKAAMAAMATRVRRMEVLLVDDTGSNKPVAGVSSTRFI
jgi:hypothetical protein